MDQNTDQSAPIQSILVVDCGTLHTRAVLLDVVEEEYRFVGGATAGFGRDFSRVRPRFGRDSAGIDMPARRAGSQTAAGHTAPGP